ncbi:GNAT family N-acetyltransferase [Bacillus mangrovi]|uniref:GNAT family N-acetyltransferase n=1 Tax=Metabacillus mangrovi TaxID=1491830 RepID=A0A7X2V4C6_9BACI|nr:GNAT family N-acetyltransferase [Metabacillus mangrovi]MTH53622.1 GNAT family N-acetyltransferase [Metabacillus mangrovi]
MNPFLHHPVIKGESVTLIPLEAEHADQLFAISDPDVWTYMLGGISTAKEMKRKLEGQIQKRADGKALPFAVTLNETGELAGTTSLYELDFSQRSCELGATWYGKRFAGTYVNSECKFLLLRYCFETLNVIRVQLKTDERNVRSQKAIERIGAKKEGILRKERILESGHIRNAVLYSIVDDEWPAVKAHLQKRIKEKQLSV